MAEVFIVGRYIRVNPVNPWLILPPTLLELILIPRIDIIADAENRLFVKVADTLENCRGIAEKVTEHNRAEDKCFDHDRKRGLPFGRFMCCTTDFNTIFAGIEPLDILVICAFIVYPPSIVRHRLSGTDCPAPIHVASRFWTKLSDVNDIFDLFFIPHLPTIRRPHAKDEKDAKAEFFVDSFIPCLRD